jgi:hypothetical protein
MNGQNRAPATCLWRAFVFCAVALASATASLQAQSSKRYRPQPEYAQLGVPDQVEGRQLLETVRQMGLSGDYYFEFELRFLPRRGEEVVWKGKLWGGRRDSSIFTRLLVHDEGKGVSHRFLLERGPRSAVWSLPPGSAVPQRLGAAELFLPIGSIMLLSPFDLQMPYFNWSEFTYEGLAKVRGRPAHRFLLYPPADIAAAQPNLCAVRMSVDSAYKAMVESELIGEGDKVLRTFSLQELKKVREQWIPKSVEVRDDNSRSKARFTVTAAAMRLSLPPSVFEPATLAEPLNPPADSSIDRF